MNNLNDLLLDEIKNPETQPTTYSYTSAKIEAGILSFLFFAFLMANYDNGIILVIAILCLIVSPVFYLINTFNKPHFHIPEAKKTKMGIWNIMNLFCLIIISFLPIVPFFYIGLLSPFLYFLTLTIWESRSSETKQPIPIVLFHTGILLFISLLAISSHISDYWILRGVYTIIAVEILSFLWMLFCVLSNKEKYGSFIFYFPRQIAFAIFGAFAFYDLLKSWL
jgi:hypothetical protein